MSDKKEIILTGFGPFGDLTSNPTEILIYSLKEDLQDKLYQLYVLPVSYDYCSTWSKDHISDSTALIIHFGVSVKSKVIQLERIGRNVIGSSSDIDGESPQRRILEEGIDSIKSGLDLIAVKSAMNSKGFICDISDNAGDYLCNFILYNSLQLAQDRTLFVHVPPENEISIEALKNFTLALLRSLEDQVK